MIGDSIFRIFWEAAAQTAAHDCREGLREQRFVLAGIEGKKRRQERTVGELFEKIENYC